MDVKVLEEKLEEHSSGLEEKINKFNELVEKTSKDEAEGVKKELKAEIEKLVNENNEKREEINAELTKVKDHLNELDMDNQKLREGNLSIKGFQEVIKEKTEDGKKLKELKDSRGSVEIEFDNLKAVMLQSADLTPVQTTPNVIPAGRRPGFLVAPEEPNHIRQIMPTGSTTSDQWSFTKESAFNDNEAMTAEGAAFPQSDFDLTVSRTPVKKAAVHMKMSNELLDDLPGIMTFAQGRLRTKHDLFEDNQILLGDGTGQNLSGLVTNQTAFAAGTFANTFGTGAQETDVLAVAINQARTTTANGLFVPNWIIMHPTDVTDRQLEKDTQGRYLLPDVYSDSATRVKGVNIFQTTILTQGTFLVCDLMNATEIIDRQGVSIEISTEDQDDFVKDLVTIRLKSRLALPIYFAGAIVGGTFAAAITALNT